ncbi:MAG: Gfo/Idh/MocA family protein [Ilumatobacter sp.]
MTEPSVGFGVIGANSFVANAAVLPGIAQSRNAHLAAAASRSRAVPQRWASSDVASYEAVLEHPDVTAVYIPLPNGMHREWTEKAAAAGKHVLCEKPLAADADTARAMAEACAAAGVILAEAWMSPFSRRYQRVMTVARSADLGTVGNIDARFTFTIGPGESSNYRWDPAQGGGALLDVGIYCLGPAVALFGAAPDTVEATSTFTDRGVDATTEATLSWNDGRRATVTCSFVDDEAQILSVSGTAGTLSVRSEAFTGGADQRELDLEVDHVKKVVSIADANDPYRAMIEAFADAVTGAAEWPRPPERSIEMLELIERIRDAAST